MILIIIVWGARGRWFESSYPDKKKSIDNQMIVDAFLFIGKLLETCGLIGGLSMEIKLLLGEINADRSCNAINYRPLSPSFYLRKLNLLFDNQFDFCNSISWSNWLLD